MGVSAAEQVAEAAALAMALDNRGNFFFRRRFLEDAKAAHTRALTIRQETGDQPGVLQSLNALGLIGLRTRELSEAAALFADTTNRARYLGTLLCERIGLMNLAASYLES